LEVLMELDKDFNEFVELFLEHNVRFLIVGGYALAAHGLPRATGDLDAWVWINPENAQNIMRALNAFGFQNLSLTESDFSKEDSIIQLGYPPFRIDILTSIDGVAFDQAWEKKVVVELNGMNVPFIGRDDLITNKKAAGRPQDIADVSRLT
jgi:hypothetical protein